MELAEKSRLSEANLVTHTAAPVSEMAASAGSPDSVDAIVTLTGLELTQGILTDKTVEARTIDDKEWEATKRRLDQQDTMIKAMIKIFSWLNGAVVIMVVFFWFGDFWRQDPIITEKVIMSIIGATIVQAGLAFMSITKFLFPSDLADRNKDKD